jgi:hypothetical protein
VVHAESEEDASGGTDGSCRASAEEVGAGSGLWFAGVGHRRRSPRAFFHRSYQFTRYMRGFKRV